MNRQHDNQQTAPTWLAIALFPLLAAASCGSQNASAEQAVEDPAEEEQTSTTEAGVSGSGETRGSQGSQGSQRSTEDKPVVQAVEVVKSYPHDPGAYTQGLVFADGRFVEGPGRYGASTLRGVRLETGEVLRDLPLDDHLFGEGVALHDGQLFQLTWKSGRVFVYDRRSFKRIGEKRLTTQGWGLVSNGTHLILSDGTDVLRFLDPKTFEEVRRISVTSEGRPVGQLNELEMVEGEIYSNVWKSNFIARIDPKDGHVIGWLNMASIIDFPPIRDEDAVLNGIAYDPKRKRLFVTGKLWPKVYEVRVKD